MIKFIVHPYKYYINNVTYIMTNTLENSLYCIPNEILDVIITYLPNNLRIHIIPFISKEFLNAHFYRTKIGRVLLTTKVYRSAIKLWKDNNYYVVIYKTLDKLMPWDIFLKDNNIHKDFSIYFGNKNTIKYNIWTGNHNHIYDLSNYYMKYDSNILNKLTNHEYLIINKLANDKHYLQSFNNYYNKFNCDINRLNKYYNENNVVNINSNTNLYNLLYTCKN